VTKDDNRSYEEQALPEGAIAIIGVSGRFPDAANISEFWQNIKAGRDCVSRFVDNELDDAFPPEVRGAPNFVKARPILKDVDLFDASFFGMHAREAALTDPQHRLFLECAWEALEDAGYDPATYPEAIGVFAGCSTNTYFLNNVCADRSVIDDFTSNFQLGNYPMLVGEGQEFLATKAAYKLDLRGPAVSVGTACSTSLTAVAQACQGLLLYQADMMLAGGVSISFPQQRGYLYQEGGMASPDGLCRPFDADAAGTVFGSGVGVVVLKRLEDAISDGDQIYAVIRAAAINNDGSGKAGYTAPSIDGQANVILAAHAMAGIDARSIGYVECHGTATPLGDPIEFSGLVKAFRSTTLDRNFCVLGSAKANVGHLDAAAGVAGLIKTVLTLRDGEIPPLLHFTSPNPQINLSDSPFLINKETIPWRRSGTPRRAGVSAFGVGGTNVHLVIEEAPLLEAAGDADSLNAAYILPLAARSPEALDEMRRRLAERLASDPKLSLDDVSHTLQIGRRHFTHRTMIVCRDVSDAIGALTASEGRVKPTIAAPHPTLAYMFPGQGTQYPGMGAELYETQPAFRDIIDKGADFLRSRIGLDLRDLLYGPQASKTENQERLRSTLFAQPALFLVEYATANLFAHCGFQPNVMIGHSIGEFVAATLASVMTFEEALGFVAERARLMYAAPVGGMLSVRLAEADLATILPEELDIAAVNAPALCVVSGPLDAIEQFADDLARRDVVARRLHTSHAFHSRMMDPVVAELAETASRIRFRAPKIPYVSCITGRWISEAEVTSPLYWTQHCRRTVRFAEALQNLRAEGNPILLEVGAGQTLTTLANQAAAWRKKETTGETGEIRKPAISSLPDATRGTIETQAFAEAVGRLWMEGFEPDWEAIHTRPCRRVSLPTYPFERKRHWIDAPQPAWRSLSDAAALNGALTRDLASGLPIGAEESHIAKEVFMESTMNMMANPSAGSASRTHRLTRNVLEIFESLSGDQIATDDYGANFIELGYDSLFLAQVATQLQKVFGIKITFRQLLNDFPSIQALVAHLDALLPPDPVAEPAPTPVAAVIPVAHRSDAIVAPQAVPQINSGSGLEGLFREQLHAMQTLLSQQLQVLQSGAANGLGVVASRPSVVTSNVAVSDLGAAASPVVTTQARSDGSPQDKPHEESETPSRFQIYRPGNATRSDDLLPIQKAFIDELVARYSAKSPGSKAMTQEYRSVLADPRAASGFRQEWKEIVYPIVCARSKGSKIWDVDDNEYVDLVNGYGQTAFGHAPDFILDAISEQMKLGFAIGPQTPLAGEVATLFAEMTGNERVTFCNTGSEAVMAAMRVARTVTGRDRVVVFNGAYHGQFDEVLVKGASRNAPPRALPVAPGIPRGSVGNMVVLPYATPESLDWIRQNADDLAAVVIETVQSRHPAFQPKAFIEEIRAITAKSESALVFDEVVTGFRVHPGGMQAVFNIRADLATYGKVVGGGMPIGVLAGKSRFMDALDGGQWRYGDDSFPEVAPTFFAGTFVRHPLVLAAARAVLLHLKEAGPGLQEKLTARTAALVARMNGELEKRGLVTRVETFSSFFYMNFGAEDRLASLLFIHMRLLGVHIHEGFPCFLTTAHSDADIEHIFSVFQQSLDALQRAEILTGSRGQEIFGEVVPPSVVLPDEVPLTEPQKEVWLAAQLGDAASCSFNESVSLDLKGSLNETALLLALEDVVGRHEILRGSFGQTGERLHIASQRVLPLERLDFSARSDASIALHDIIDEDAHTPFDLANGPLARARLIKLASDHHVLVFSAHHIICDGWSMNVIMNDLAAFYAARAEGCDAGLPPVLAFRRYALNEAAKSGAASETETYWLDQYKTIPASLELAADRPRAAQKTFAGATYSATIEEGLYRDVRKAGAKQGCTLFTTLFAAFQILLSKLTGSEELVIGVPTAGQSLLDDEILVGHCVNFLPIRGPVDFSQSVGAHLQAVRKVTGDAFDHQDFTFGTLVRKLNLPRDPRRLPLTSVQFNLEKLGESADFPGLSVSMAPNAKAFVNFDLFMNVIESDRGLRIDCDYSTELFDESTIARWVDYFRMVLVSIARDPAQQLTDVSLLSPGERDWLLSDLNDTKTDVDLRSIADLIGDQVAQHPDEVAAICKGVSLTYRELDDRASHLARGLRKLVSGEGRRIALAVDRSLDMLIALIAIMKAGHAYVPLDPQHPEARLRLVLDTADVSALICDSDALAAMAGDLPVVRLGAGGFDVPLSQDPLPPVSAEASAYVIFTSGSTGVPKGVEIAHQSVANLLWSMASVPGFTQKDILVAGTTIAFDIAALELYLPLIRGGVVVIASREDVKGGFGFISLIETYKATVVQATPSLWRILLEAGLKPHSGLKMLCGGEALPRDLADQLLATDGELWNVYGPTETTIWSSIGRVQKGSASITIGTPVFNTQLHILDEHRRLAPIGVFGELYIGGLGLARGYFRRPDLDAGAFFDLSLMEGAQQRLYRTGDKGRRLPDGSIELVGRLDQQIKLRGFRIELGDIESVIRQCTGIADCAVALQASSGETMRLVGYYVEAKEGALSPAMLSSHVASRLPDYMVPTVWLKLDRLPLTPNGKLDRKALPVAEVGIEFEHRVVTPPRTEMEKRLVAIWKEVLKLPDVGIDDNIFSLGVDSIQIFRLALRMREQNINLSAADLMQHPTIEELAKAEAKASSADQPQTPSLSSFRRRGGRMTGGPQ